MTLTQQDHGADAAHNSGNSKDWEVMRDLMHQGLPGLYLRQQASEEIAAVQGFDAFTRVAIDDAMQQAIFDGKLRTYDLTTGLALPAGPLKHFQLYWLVSPSDVNQWLESRGAPYRWSRACADHERKGAANAATVPPAPEASPVEAAPGVEAPASEPGKTETVTHTTKTPRRDTLTPVIELAQNQCRNPKDTAEVWARLQVLAESKSPPLIGTTEEGLQYLKNGMAAIFKRDDLRKRLGR